MGCSRILLSPGWVCSREIALPYRLQVIVQLCDVCSLLPLVTDKGNSHRATWPTYNAICFLYKLIQVLHAEDIRLDRGCIVFDQHLVEYGSDVHCGAVQCTWSSLA
jgi:hypothetical protein